MIVDGQVRCRGAAHDYRLRGQCGDPPGVRAGDNGKMQPGVDLGPGGAGNHEVMLAGGALPQPTDGGRCGYRLPDPHRQPGQSAASAATGGVRTAERAGSTEAARPATNAISTTSARSRHGTANGTGPIPDRITAEPAQP